MLPVKRGRFILLQARDAAVVLIQSSARSRQRRDDVDIDDARLLLRNCLPAGSRDELWSRVEGFVPRGREQTAWYAFLDLWEELHGAD